ncbi:hypothetical protein [Dyadobacter jiangsuensis]|uniref:hypothetical protein n=1 Tax=Dyadobacter jiangsuensis TaxID=1591085 RepID=UPI000D0E03E5|nr:hypothetical protein [Dyadobacter jiangsuensis]
MKYTGNTISKPVTGKSAEKLAEAVKSGTYVSNKAARETIQQILDHKRQQITPDAAKNQV